MLSKQLISDANLAQKGQRKQITGKGYINKMTSTNHNFESTIRQLRIDSYNFDQRIISCLLPKSSTMPAKIGVIYYST